MDIFIYIYIYEIYVVLHMFIVPKYFQTGDDVRKRPLSLGPKKQP